MALLQPPRPNPSPAHGVEAPLQLGRWVEEAGQLRGRQRAKRVSQINRALRQLAPGRAQADVLLELLESGKLEDQALSSCRALAVEVLLHMGYPYALEIRPEDLSYYRAHARRPPAGWLWALALVAAGLLAFGVVLL